MDAYKICVKPMSTKDIRTIALNLRRMIGVKNNKKFPILYFIEWFVGNPDNDFSYEIEDVENMTGMYGLTDTNKNVMKIRLDVYEGAVKENPRDIFTLCHELGHYLLHQPEEVEFARGEMDIPAYRNPEWQANMFAAELLAPYEQAKSMSIEQIANTYGMSMQAATIRYKQCRK